MDREIQKKLVFIIFLIAGVVIYGTAGYMIIEKINFLDALYMTVITLATVGYREVKDLTANGKIFTILLIISGFGVFTYALTTGAKIIIEGEIKEAFKKRKMKKQIDSLKDHYIICGYGRMGKIIAKELRSNNIPFVIIEKNRENLPADEETLYIEGDATKDDVLKNAGIEKAKGLITVLSSDTENLYVVLSAKGLNPELFIVARAAEEGAEIKLKRAGADKVVSPYHIGGLRIAHTVLRPTVVDFLEFATRSEHIEIQIEEIPVRKDSWLAGKTIGESDIGRGIGAIIIGIKRSDGSMKFNPTSQTRIEDGDTLIVLGEAPRLLMLEKMASSRNI
ncbi:MAG: potassium channel protein [Thermodesulfovibrionales bacterium]|nr:potassium channel protein [Thermodesulfovibrionales bacterium]